MGLGGLEPPTSSVSASVFPVGTPVPGGNRVRLLPAYAVSTVIVEVDYQRGAGSQPWALQCRYEHEDQFPPATPFGSRGRKPPWDRPTVEVARC
jgi:hypothetical protein